MTTTYSTYGSTPPASMTTRGPGGRILVALGLLLLAAAVASGSWSLVTRVFGGSTLDITATATAVGARTVTVVSDNADISVIRLTSETADTVSVHATGRYGRGEPQVTALSANGNVLVEVRCSDGWFDWCSLDATVALPANLDVTVQNDNGGVKVSGTSASGVLRAFTDNGDIDVDGGTGTLELGSDNGDISVENSSARSVTMTTDNGHLDLRSLVDLNLVQARSNNGDVTITVPGDVKYQVSISSDNGEASSDLGADSESTYRITGTTGNGDVRVRAAVG
jgi:Putative adhesin